MSINHSSALRRHVAIVMIATVTATPVSPLLQAQTTAAKAPATAAKAPATAAPTPPPPDGGWPRAYSTASGAALVVYQPQISTWANQKHAVMYTAVSYTQKGAAKPALGTMKVESDTSGAVYERLVSFSQLKLAEPNFPTLSRDQVATVVKEFTAAIPLDDRVIALDRVLANIDTSQVIPKNVEGVKADPPPIFFSKTPAMLVNIDGEPIWAPIQQNDLTSAVNTNWDLFQHVPTKTYFLRNEKIWMRSPDVVKGPWTPAGALPESFKKLPADDNWKDVKASL